MRGGLTIDIFIPKDILEEPGSFTRAMWFIGSNPIVFLPFVTFGVMYVLWYYKGRDPDPATVTSLQRDHVDLDQRVVGQRRHAAGLAHLQP